MADARLRAFVLWFLSVGLAQLTLAEGWLHLAAALPPAGLALAILGSIAGLGLCGSALALAGTGAARGLLEVALRWRRSAAGPDAMIEAALELDDGAGSPSCAVSSLGGCLAATGTTLGQWSLLFALQGPAF